MDVKISSSSPIISRSTANRSTTKCPSKAFFDCSSCRTRTDVTCSLLYVFIVQLVRRLSVNLMVIDSTYFRWDSTHRFVKDKPVITTLSWSFSRTRRLTCKCHSPTKSYRCVVKCGRRVTVFYRRNTATSCNRRCLAARLR